MTPEQESVAIILGAVAVAVGVAALIIWSLF
jgi:hypothetical protein